MKKNPRDRRCTWQNSLDRNSKLQPQTSTRNRLIAFISNIDVSLLWERSSARGSKRCRRRLLTRSPASLPCSSVDRQPSARRLCQTDWLSDTIIFLNYTEWSAVLYTDWSAVLPDLCCSPCICLWLTSSLCLGMYTSHRLVDCKRLLTHQGCG